MNPCKINPHFFVFFSDCPMKVPLILPLIFSGLWLSSCNKPTTSTQTNTATPDRGLAGEVSPTLTTVSTLPEVVSFNEHIQPILSDTCYHCHGPDSGTREPKKEPLRLDRAEYAFAKREDGLEVIKPGDPANSTMIQLIKEKDLDLRMPPPEAHKEITPRQLALLERWIEQGAIKVAAQNQKRLHLLRKEGNLGQGTARQMAVAT